ncbi:MAG: hypothetical protein OXH28_14130 [bacterium]|nr:hypothetical protein [bacterium]
MEVLVLVLLLVLLFVGLLVVVGLLRWIFGGAKLKTATDLQRSYLNDLFDRSGSREITLLIQDRTDLKLRVPENERLSDALDRRHPGLLSKDVASQLIDGIIDHNRQVAEERDEELQDSRE